MLSIHYIVLAPEMCYRDHDEVVCKPLFKNQVRKHCIFYITWIVGILLTVGVILNFDWCVQFTTIFFAPEMGYLDHAEVYYKALWCKNQVSNFVCSISPILSAYYWHFGWC